MPIITLKWKSYRWRPAAPPDQIEYDLLRRLGEQQMRAHLKTLLDKVRSEMAIHSPYSYRRAIVAFVIAVVLMFLGSALDPRDGRNNLLPLGLECCGLLLLVGALLHWGSTSMTHDSIRKNLIVAREYYVRCWVAAQKLEYGPFHKHIQKLIDRGPPNYDLQ